MITREEILSIEEYCAEHKVSHRKRLEELNIPFCHFYKAKKKYRKDDEQDAYTLSDAHIVQAGVLSDAYDKGMCAILSNIYLI